MLLLLVKLLAKRMIAIKVTEIGSKGHNEYLPNFEDEILIRGEEL